MRARFLLCLLVAVVIVGCSSAPKSAKDASMLEVVFGDNIERYLQERREVLANLRRQLDGVEDELIDKLGGLASLEKKLRVAVAKENDSSSELSKTLKQVSDLRIQGEKARLEVAELLEDVNQKNKDLSVAKADIKNDEIAIERLGQKVTKIKGDNVVTNRAVIRTLEAKAAELLREEAYNN